MMLTLCGISFKKLKLLRFQGNWPPEVLPKSGTRSAGEVVVALAWSLSGLLLSATRLSQLLRQMASGS